MKLAIVCANGKAGACLQDEAVRRGMEVTAFIRKGKANNPAVRTVVKDLFDINGEDLATFDAVIDAFGAWTEDTLPQHTTSLMHLCDALSGSGTRLLIVGGAGSLYTDETHTARLMDGPNFPDAFKPLAASMGEALEKLRARKDVRWTYLSPAADFRADGPRTGSYLLGGEELILNGKGESVISYQDYAVAMIDEAEKGGHDMQRISVVSK